MYALGCRVRASGIDEVLTAFSSAVTNGAVDDFNECCRKYNFQGEEVSLDDYVLLGHVRIARDFFEHLRRQLISHSSTNNGRQIIHTGDGVQDRFRVLSKSEGEVSERQRFDAEDWFASNITALMCFGSHLTWLFAPEDLGSDPFDTDMSLLPWRLALPYLCSNRTKYNHLIDRGFKPVDEEQIGFRIKVSEMTGRPRTPTPFDAEYEGLTCCWQPGGITVPHNGNPPGATAGLREYVVKNLVIAAVQRSFVFFEAKGAP